MIFITVGTAKFQFNRLLEEVDRLVGAKKIKDKVIAQAGYSDYKPKNYEYFSFTDSDRIERLNKTADIVISHAGAGCIISALKYNRPVIVVPRLARFKEHSNDHQKEIAKELAEQGKVVAVFDMKKLGDAVRRMKNFNPKGAKAGKLPIINILGKYLQEIEKGV